MPVKTDDGYSGTLHLDHTSIMVEETGYATKNHEISVTRLYPDLSDADLSLIPKTIEDDGRTLILDDVEWENGWQTDAENGFIRYSATANYVGTVSSEYATGYTVTANYTGEVSRSNVEMITYRVDFVSVREAEPVETPPVPENYSNISEEISDNPEEIPASMENISEPEINVETAADEAELNPENNPDTEEIPADEDSGNQAGWRYISADETDKDGTPEAVQKPEFHWKSADYSRLKRTVSSCGLLLFLAVTAYLISKIKQRGGNSS